MSWPPARSARPTAWSGVRFKRLTFGAWRTCYEKIIRNFCGTSAAPLGLCTGGGSDGGDNARDAGRGACFDAQHAAEAGYLHPPGRNSGGGGHGDGQDRYRVRAVLCVCRAADEQLVGGPDACHKVDRPEPDKDGCRRGQMGGQTRSLAAAAGHVAGGAADGAAPTCAAARTTACCT